MTRIVEMVVPPTGETIDSARLVAWIVQPGQAFKAGDPFLEIETDKSVIEVPAPADGVMVEHLVDVDGLLNADTPIARVQVEGEGGSAQPGLTLESPVSRKEELAAEASGSIPVGQSERSAHDSSTGHEPGKRRFATPVARRLAGDRGVAIDAIQGTGPNERVTKADVLRAPSRPARAGAVDATKAGPARPEVQETTVATVHGDVSVRQWVPRALRSGPTVALIHGMFADSNAWASMAHAISLAGWPVLAMDLPCHGTTSSSVASVAEIVDVAAEVISGQCQGPVVLVSHSFGGAVAARLASKPNLRVSSLVLIAPVGTGTTINQSFFDGMLYAGTHEAVRRELAKLTVAGATPSAAYVDELRESIRGRHDSLLKLSRQISRHGVQQIDLALDVAALRIPVVVIQGRRDEIIPWRHVLNLPGQVAIHLLPDAGHMPQWESTSLVTQIVLKELARAP